MRRANPKGRGCWYHLVELELTFLSGDRLQEDASGVLQFHGHAGKWLTSFIPDVSPNAGHSAQNDALASRISQAITLGCETICFDGDVIEVAILSRKPALAIGVAHDIADNLFAHDRGIEIREVKTRSPINLDTRAGNGVSIPIHEEQSDGVGKGICDTLSGILALISFAASIS